MSARAYDSDAQCIGSPQHGDHMKASSRSPGFRRMGLNDLIEHSREHNNSELWVGRAGHDESNTPGAPFGMHFIPTPQGSMKGRAGATHANFGTEGIVNQPGPLFQNERAGEQSKSARSVPSLDESRERLVPPSQNRSGEGVMGSSSENLQNLVADWAQYLGSNPNDFRTASSASLARQGQNIMISKTRYPTSSPKTGSETRVPHLGGLDLSHRLVGTNMTSGPPSLNPSMSEIPRANRYGLQMVSQENLPSCGRSGASTLMGKDLQKPEIHHQRDVSSFYSRQSSNRSGGVSPVVQSLRARAGSGMESLPNVCAKLMDETASAHSGLASSADVPKSKCVEQLDTGNLGSPKGKGLSDGVNGARSQRKVSPGWMTGGRRVGYGYSLVDNAEDYSPTAAGSSYSPPSGGWHRDIPTSMSGTFNAHGIDTSTNNGIDIGPSNQPGTPDQSLKRSNSRSSPMTANPINEKGEPILTPTMWAKMKKHSMSMRRNARAPLAVYVAREGMPTSKASHAASDIGHQNRSPTSPNVDYIEDTGESMLGRWARMGRSPSKRAPPAKDHESTPGNNIFTPEMSPIGVRRFSIDQTNRPVSVYFDPSNNRSADKFNQEPSRSRSGRWILRFSRNRDSKRRVNLSPEEPLNGSAVRHEEYAVSSLQRADSTRSNVAEELASAYQDCIQMPGAFYGSRWASRTSLVVEAE